MAPSRSPCASAARPSCPSWAWLPRCNVEDIERAWSRREPAFVPTAVLCPPLQALLDLRQAIGLRGPGHTVAKMIHPVRGAPALRLVNHTHPEFGALMSAWAQREAVDAMLLRGTEGEPVADPRRQPRIDTWLGGALRPELSAAAQEGVLTAMPLLPRETDAASTAVYVQEVISGTRPAPPPLARQVALIIAAVAALRGRSTVHVVAGQGHELAIKMESVLAEHLPGRESRAKVGLIQNVVDECLVRGHTNPPGGPDLLVASNSKQTDQLIQGHRTPPPR